MSEVSELIEQSDNYDLTSYYQTRHAPDGIRTRLVLAYIYPWNALVWYLLILYLNHYHRHLF